MTLDSPSAPAAPETDNSLPRRTLRKALNASFGNGTTDPSSHCVEVNTLRGILRAKSEYTYDGELDHLRSDEVKEEIATEFGFRRHEWDADGLYSKKLVKEMYDWARNNSLLTKNVDSAGTVQRIGDFRSYISREFGDARLTTVNTDKGRKIDSIKEIRSVLDGPSRQRSRLSKNPLLIRMYISFFKECPKYGLSREDLKAKILDGLGIEDDTESPRFSSEQVTLMLVEVSRLDAVYVGDNHFSPCPVCGAECPVSVSSLKNASESGFSDVCVRNTGHKIQVFEHVRVGEQNSVVEHSTEDSAAQEVESHA